ncbi:MAG: hypothetical protein QOF74_1989, partial [Caballeronia mineralivorans]|nr:hypothetical protein [Caballeronia mineralivorans]
MSKPSTVHNRNPQTYVFLGVEMR